MSKKRGRRPMARANLRGARIVVLATVTDKRRWERAARQKGVSLSEWIRQAVAVYEPWNVVGKAGRNGT